MWKDNKKTKYLTRIYTLTQTYTIKPKPENHVCVILPPYKRTAATACYPTYAHNNSTQVVLMLGTLTKKNGALRRHQQKDTKKLLLEATKHSW